MISSKLVVVLLVVTLCSNSLFVHGLRKEDAQKNKAFEGPQFKFSGMNKLREERGGRDSIEVRVPRGRPLTPRKPGEPLITNYGPSSGHKDALNVAIVPHSHDDVGWLKTVDQYFMGMNNSIYNAGVQYVLDSVVVALKENPDRKFIEVEIGFFKRWWDQQNNNMKADVRTLVSNGQLEFINGGWCMSDEAAPYYVDMIDQQACGHQFLLKEFGTAGIPKTGWQIDPFGHSAFMGNLYAQMGMNSWFFGRIDYQDRAFREKDHTAEVVMRTSASLGEESDIFTGVTRGYGALTGFEFELGFADPIQDDVRLEGYNVDEKIDSFVQQCYNQAAAYKTNIIMLTMGTDFCYENANSWYKSLDRLVHYAAQDGRTNVFYATPTDYTNMKHAADVSWPTKEDDWFPYADYEHAVWTGYFTSRPGLKGYVKTGSNYLQACRQIEAQTWDPNRSASSQALWEAMGVAQHHDAVSGTSKQHVADDYAKRIYLGVKECEELVTAALADMSGSVEELSTCPLLNETDCDLTVGATNVGMIVYNGLAQSQIYHARIPVSPSVKSVSVVDAMGNKIKADVIPTEKNAYVDKPVALAVFNMEIPAMGFSSATIEMTTSGTADATTRSVAKGKDVQISNAAYELTFDGDSGMLKQVKMQDSGETLAVSNYFAWYNSSDGQTAENRGQASGAYIFRPNCTEDVKTPCDPYLVHQKATITAVIESAAVSEVVQQFDSWITQSVRLYHDGSGSIEVQWTVGPLPVGSEMGGMEVVSVWQTDIKNQQTWCTDSNGRDMQERKFNYRPGWKLNVTDPVSGNFYPVNSALYFQDNSTRATFLVDRSQAGAMLRDGQAQFMVHRRLNYDDHRGVGEVLNETAGPKDLGLVVRGTQRVIFASTQKSPAIHKSEGQRIMFPPLPMFTNLHSKKNADSWMKSLVGAASGLNVSLPDNVHLLTVQDNSEYGAQNSLVLRFAHLFEVDEDKTLSEPAKISLDGLFTNIALTGCVEMSITVNQKASDMKRMKWKTETSFSTPDKLAGGYRGPMLAGEDHFSLFPMQIRTFRCDYKPVQYFKKRIRGPNLDLHASNIEL